MTLGGDKEGNDAKARYLRELSVGERQILQLTDIFGAKFKVIESLISGDMKAAIAKKYSVAKVSKKHIQRAFSEALSGVNNLPADEIAIKNLAQLCATLDSKLPT